MLLKEQSVMHNTMVYVFCSGILLEIPESCPSLFKILLIWRPLLSLITLQDSPWYLEYQIRQIILSRFEIWMLIVDPVKSMMK
jgi:hypothetical protein